MFGTLGFRRDTGARWRRILFAAYAASLVFVCACRTQCLAQPLCFSPQVDYPSGNGPYAIAAADLDADGDHDLAVASFDGGNVTVHMNVGDGTFLGGVSYPAGDSPISLVAADLDGDDDIDIAVANWLSEAVSVLLNHGNGTFQPPLEFAVGQGPRSVTVADLNGDSFSDLAVANRSSDNVSILFGNGVGMFSTAFNYPAGDGPWSVIAIDLDGDSDDDLAVTDYFSDSITLLVNAGDGTYPVALQVPVGLAPRACFPFDLEGDGDLDIAVAAGSYTVTVLINDGTGGFADTSVHFTGDTPSSVIATDVSGDAFPDLVVTNIFDLDVSVLRNLGDGSFATAVSYPISNNYPAAVAAIDLDGDGDNDLAVANHYSDNVAILTNCIATGQECTAGVDADGDGLEDCWEIQGYDADGDGTVDVNLPAMGADPLRQDIFVEVDWMTAGAGETQSHAFRPEAQSMAIEMFESAGIRLHLDVGQGGAFTGGGEIPHDDDLNPLGVELASLKSTYFDSAREAVFHYCVFGHMYDGSGSSGISEGIPGHDFVVTLGGFSTNPGTIYQQAGTFVHELGHNLGLRHGGSNHLNYKPNFLSTMNYYFQMSGLIIDGSDGHFDYSNWVIDLDATELDETLGLAAGTELDDYTMFFQCNTGAGCMRRHAPANGPVDWNCDGEISAGTASHDVTCSGGLSVITGYDDWSNLDLAGFKTAANSKAARMAADSLEELTEEEYLSFAILHGDMDDDADHDAVDLALMIDLVFFGGPEPSPAFRGFVDCGNSVSDAVDLATLIDIVFFGAAYPECY